MNQGMDKVEIILAHRLASGDPTTRRRAFAQLYNYVKCKCRDKGFLIFNYIKFSLFAVGIVILIVSEFRNF